MKEFLIVMFGSIALFVFLNVWVNIALKEYVKRCKRQYEERK